MILNNRLHDGASSGRPHRPPAAWGFVLLMALLSAGTARAGHITLQISTTPTVAEKQVLCTVSIVNQGDESAASVQAHVEFRGTRFSAQVMPVLAVGQSYTGNFQIPRDRLASGRYTLVVMTDYTDTNGYPFTALSTAGFVVGEDFPPQIHGMAEPVELGGTEPLTLRLKNQGKKDLQAQLRLVLPKEISADPVERVLGLGALQENDAAFSLRNFSALEGSTYQVFVLAEYSDAGRHSSLPIPCTVKIVAARSFFQKYKIWILVAGSLLGLLFVGIQLYSFVSRRRSSLHSRP